MVTIREVAERAGVSIPVVSAFLHGSKTVGMSETTRKRVGAAIAELEYRPNRAAQALRTSRTQSVAVVVPKPENPALGELLQGVYDGAAATGYVSMVIDAARLRSDTQLLEHVLSQGTFDGVIARRANSLDPSVLSDLSRRGLPTLFLDNEATSGRFTWLALDDELGMRTATQVAIEAGHRDIVLLGGRDTVPDAAFVEIRYRGYQAAMAAAGYASRPHIECGQAAEDGYTAFATLLAPRIVERDPDAPTAVVVNNATTATGVLAAAIDAGIDVPAELSIVGYHDVEWARVVRPRLTTVRMPMHELGLAGFRALTRMIDGEHVEPAILREPPPLVMDRGSVVAPRS